MADIILARRARKQPQGFGRIDRSNDLQRDLLCVVNAYQRFDSLDEIAYVQEGSFSQVPTADGIGFSTNGSSSLIYRPIKPIALTKWTLYGVFKSNINGADTRAMALGSSTDTDPILQIGSSSTDATKIRLWARDDVGVSPSDASSNASAFDGTVHDVFITYDGQVLSCYIDGKLDSANAWLGGVATVDRFCIGALYRATAAAHWSGTTILGAAWKRDLKAAEIATLSRNRWQLFRGASERVLSATGQSSIDLAATVTSPSRTAAALSTGISLTASAASRSITTVALNVGSVWSVTTNSPADSRASLATGIALAASVRTESRSTAALSLATDLAAAVSSRCQTSASLSTGIAMAAASRAVAATSAQLATQITLQAFARTAAQSTASLLTEVAKMRAPDGAGYAPRRPTTGWRQPAIQRNAR